MSSLTNRFFKYRGFVHFMCPICTLFDSQILALGLESRKQYKGPEEWILTLETLAQRLRRLRELKGLSLAEVARHLSISESTYREWEKGRSIQGEPYVQLAQLYEVSLAYLLGADEAVSVEQILKWIKKDIEIIEGKIKGR